jgi:hypothetical protein
MSHGIDGRPGAAFGFVVGNSAAFIALFDMFGLPLLFLGILTLVSTGHFTLLVPAR